MQNRDDKAAMILELLHKDCRLSLEQISTMLNLSTDEVAGIIDELEKKNVILGYGARINWDEANGADAVTAYIELRVTPQRDLGYDRIAERIYQYPEVKAVNLMSGSYDFGITVEGKNIREVSQFVSEHLAPMESVIGTATHFVLKRYKYDGVICARPSKDEREVISL
ncbi:MAG: Lrp/AsnC family transcriptional regulator [Clostridia bacterium]|nr:Lrp/AsnC family transcriptional regulator [Clostridia bacterium]